MKRQVADRLFLTSISVTIVGVSYVQPVSLMWRLVSGGGLWGHACMLALLCMALIAAADTIVNDMLPEKYLFRTALGRRRGIWMILAITYAGIAFVIVRSGYGYSTAIFYTIFALRCAAVSFLDMYYEFRVRDNAPNLGGTIPGALSDD